MHYSNNHIRKLIEKYREISLLSKTKGLLDWDLNVNLPEKASEIRSEQSAHITKLIAEGFQDPSFRNLLEKLSQNKNRLSDTEKAMVRNLEWSSQYYYRVPKELIVEFAKTTSEAFMAWHQAKKEDNFLLFLPFTST